MPINDAINKALEYTQKTQHESGFIYDTETQQLLSPIILGCANNIEGGYSSIDIDERKKPHRLGHFHTHPQTELELDFCFFSPSDIYASFFQGHKQQILGCITKKGKTKIIEMDYGNSTPKEILTDLEEIHALEEDVNQSRDLYATRRADAELKQGMTDFLARYPLKRDK